MSFQTGRTSTTKSGVSLRSDEASAWKIVFRMSSGSYSGLAMHEPVHVRWKEFMTAPKIAPTGKTEQYVVSSYVEQLIGLPKSSVVVRNVDAVVWRSRGGITQWLVNLRDGPAG